MQSAPKTLNAFDSPDTGSMLSGRLFQSFGRKNFLKDQALNDQSSLFVRFWTLNIFISGLTVTVTIYTVDSVYSPAFGNWGMGGLQDGGDIKRRHVHKAHVRSADRAHAVGASELFVVTATCTYLSDRHSGLVVKASAS